MFPHGFINRAEKCNDWRLPGKKIQEMIQCSEKGSDQDKMQSCALNAGDNLCADSMKDFFEIGCNIMDNMLHKFNPHINI